MSADATHQVISKNLRTAGKVENLQDYVTATECAGKKVMIMQPSVNTVKTEELISRYSLKMLADEGKGHN